MLKGSQPTKPLVFNRMKRLTVVLVLVLGALIGQAQTTTPSQKVSNALTPQELSSLTPSEIGYFNFVAERGFVFHQMGKDGQEYPLLSTTLKSQFKGSKMTAESFNPLMLTNWSERNTHKFYRVDGTDMVVQIYSDSFATTLYSDYLINQKNHSK
jgi:hypothetical protein